MWIGRYSGTRARIKGTESVLGRDTACWLSGQRRTYAGSGRRESRDQALGYSRYSTLLPSIRQARAILTFVDAISEKTLRSTVTLTASRGRGKSAALGTAIAAAVAYGYSNIFVTSPSPENLKTLFEFVFKGFDALGYEEHLDYDIIQSTNPDFNKDVVRVNVFRDHRQTIQVSNRVDS